VVTAVVGTVGVVVTVVDVDLTTFLGDVVGGTISGAVSGAESSDITTASWKPTNISGISDFIVGAVRVACCCRAAISSGVSSGSTSCISSGVFSASKSTMQSPCISSSSDESCDNI